ncbi:TetR/AcrR family transcriptional regulator [Paenibacillus sp. MBLB4367]|uniref:TetR/AcrR family transcriptional regulator n=1 Tax=Paenibacillus sp. MBLB4367 TaxID=3384767 RepID=UPI00390814B3
MGRPKAFDEEQALDRAMELFWTKGYERTSIQELCEHSGLHRGSMYDTFGDKNELFLACLDRFRQTSKGTIFAVLDEAGEPKELLERFFEQVIVRSLDDGKQRRGCFMANTAMELAQADANVASRVEANMLDTEQIFYRFLLRAQKNGNLKSKHSLRELARFLVNTKQGLHVMAKTTTDAKVLQDVCKVALSFLF